MLIYDNKIKVSKLTNDSHEHCSERFHCAKSRRSSLLDNERIRDFILMGTFLLRGDRERSI